ncbi:Epidermal growth factor-like protein 7 [Vespula maculifrons]|uniref:Epidermal growth factor-like protein 7 n=1 Tax=Vespula maculifrons TaxID=7453 RepID=A0ABD2CDK1_VESMC
MVGLVARGTKHVGPQVRVSPSVVLSAAFGLFRTGCPSTVLDASVAPFAAPFRDGECELLTREEEASSFSPFRGPDAYGNDDDVETTIATAPTIGSSMRPIVRSNATRPDKFGAIAVAEYAGTRAIAYAGFHEDHRHRALSEATTRGYQRILTTTPTYTRHHSGFDSFLTIYNS